MKTITQPRQDRQDTALANAEPLVTAARVAAELNIHKRTVALHAERGTLPHYRIGTTIRFRMSEVWKAIKGGGRHV